MFTVGSVKKGDIVGGEYVTGEDRQSHIWSADNKCDGSQLKKIRQCLNKNFKKWRKNILWQC
jgi:hypothetical protein